MSTHEAPELEACGICGRTILRGESVVQYASPDGEIVPVCALCTDRVQSVGWVPADSMEDAPPTPARRRRWFGGFRARRRSPAAPPDEPEEPTLPETPADLALQRFNASDAARIVAGLSKSLGPPRAAVRAEGSGAEVTVAWDLSWYRWEVGLNGEEEPRRVGKGTEVAELEDEDLDWNAEADEEGRLRWLND